MSFEKLENNKEKENKGIIIEIGCGDLPVMATSERKMERFKDDPSLRYIGIDTDRNEFDMAARRINEVAKNIEPNETIQKNIKDRIMFVQASGTKLPLENESVKEVVMVNVLGEPDLAGKGNMIKEITRALINGGKLKIIEMYTPNVAKKERNMLTAYSQNKLKLIKEITTKNLNNGIDDEDISLIKSWCDSFIWEFEKKDE